MSSKAFQQDLKRGQVAEELLFNILNEWGWGPERSEGYYPEWDIRLPNSKSIEVKYDEKSAITGNIYLEEKAIEHSKSDIWAIATGKPINRFLLVETEKIKKLYEILDGGIKGGEFMEPAKLIDTDTFIEVLNPKVIEV